VILDVLQAGFAGPVASFYFLAHVNSSKEFAAGSAVCQSLAADGNVASIQMQALNPLWDRLEIRGQFT
jgi:hypothetical protein